MIFTIKKLTNLEKKYFFKTISAKAIFAIIGDAVKNKKGISIVRAGDGEFQILNANKNKSINFYNKQREKRIKRLGINRVSIKILQKNILEAGNTCTYFAPSVSGISIPRYNVYKFFKPRPFYFDNFFINEWTGDMIKMLLEASGGAFIINREYKEIIKNFQKNYNFDSKLKIRFDGFPKERFKDNDQTIKTALSSGMQLILFSAGPAGKIIGPKITKHGNQITLDVGNTLMPWSKKKPEGLKISIK